MAKNIEINIKGSDGNYEVLYPKTNSSITVINQDIINQFGLADGSGLSDVLGELGKYNEYWWRRRVAGGEWEYLYSLNRNAYPNSGIQDGYEYEYLGVPYQQMSQTPNGILIGTFQIKKTAFGGTKLFDSTEIEAGCGYYFTVDYDIAWTNNSGKSMQIGLMITSKSSGIIFDTSEGFCYNVSYGYQKTTGQEQGNSRIYYVNNVKDIFLCLHADTSAYDCNFLSTGIYFNFAGPNLTTSQLNNITISKANFTINVYKQVLC